jgi:hypothetical protein
VELFVAPGLIGVVVFARASAEPDRAKHRSAQVSLRMPDCCLEPSAVEHSPSFFLAKTNEHLIPSRPEKFPIVELRCLLAAEWRTSIVQRETLWGLFSVALSALTGSASRQIILNRS